MHYKTILHKICFGEPQGATSRQREPYWNRVEVAAVQYGVEIDYKNPEQSRLSVALALDKAGRPVEAFEIMMNKKFSFKGPEFPLLLTYVLSPLLRFVEEPAEKFYSKLLSIDPY